MNTIATVTAELDTLHGEAAAIRTALSHTETNIQEEPSRNEAWKRDELRDARARSQDKLHELEQREQDRLRETEKQLEKKLFGLGVGSAQADVLNFRDATDRASRFASNDESGALRAIRQATLSDDAFMARALFVRAHESGWEGVLSAYFEAYPSRSDEYSALKKVGLLRGDDVTRHYRYSLSAVDASLPTHLKK